MPDSPASQSSDQKPPAGWYADPENSALRRWWDGDQWTTDTRAVEVASAPTQSEAEVSSVHRDDAPVRESAEAPTATQTTATASGSASNEGGGSGALILAVIWLVAAVIIGGITIAGVEESAYGGDAYTDIQNAGVATVRAIGWLIISTGPLGLIIALSRR